MQDKIICRLNGKHIIVFQFFKFFNLLAVFAHGNYSAVVKPGIVIYDGKNAPAVDLLRGKVKDFYFRQLIVNVLYDLFCIVKNVGAEI